MNTLFEKIIAGELPAFKIWEDEDFFAFLDITPINPGHTLLVPKSAGGYIFDLEEKKYCDLWQRAKILAGALQRAMECKRVAIAVEGFGVPHVHIHLVPVNSGNELNPERAKPATDDDLAKAQELIKRELNCRPTK